MEIVVGNMIAVSTEDNIAHTHARILEVHGNKLKAKVEYPKALGWPQSEVGIEEGAIVKFSLEQVEYYYLNLLDEDYLRVSLNVDESQLADASYEDLIDYLVEEEIDAHLFDAQCREELDDDFDPVQYRLINPHRIARCVLDS